MQQNLSADGAAPPLEWLDISVDRAPRGDHVDTAAAKPAGFRVAAAVVAVLGLLAGIGALTIRNDAPAALATPVVASATTVSPPSGLEGFAEMFLATYVTAAGPGRAESLARFHPGAPQPEEEHATRFARHITTLGATRLPGGVWELHIAADVLVHDGIGYQPDGTHHYLVGVLDTPQGFTATSLPLRIASPPPAPIPTSPGGSLVEDAGLTGLIRGFLSAYLAGKGDVRTFVAPGASYAPITPPPFTSVALDTLTAVPGSGDAVELRAVGTAHNPHGAVRIEHHFRVTGADGVWLIEAMSVAAAGPTATAGSATTDPTGS